MADSLTAKLAAIKQEIGAVGKDSRMTEGPAKYAYRGHDAILQAAHEALIKHEVSVIPVDAVATYESRQSKNGNHMQWVSLAVRWEVRGAGECFPGASVGEALDTSDKATNKAHTAAEKVFVSQLIKIPYSGDDPDHSRPESEPAVVQPNPDLVASLQARLDALPIHLRSKAVNAGRDATGIDSLDSIDEMLVTDTWAEWWDHLLAKAEAKWDEDKATALAENEEPF